MTIQKNQYEEIVESLDIGNSIAEYDLLLESARVETPVFWGVLNDKYDMVLGRKGAGKTAIFKLIITFAPLLLGQKIIVLSGVNSSGESIFNKYKDQFSTFSEEEFENFWKLYIISLVDNQFIKDPKFEEKLSNCKTEIENFRTACRNAGIPNIPAQQDQENLLSWVMHLFPKGKKIKRIKIPIAVGIPENPGLFSTAPEIEFQDQSEVQQKEIYVNKISATLKALLEKSGFKIWIILDRLDEVFERYSLIEFNGLRGLLRAYKGFDLIENNQIFRIKIFLRDDIKSFLTDDSIYQKYFHKTIPALPAATHIFSKESPTLTWTEDEIEQLILNRLILNNKLIRDYLGITENYSVIGKSKIIEKVKEELRNKQCRVEYWNKIFPPKISSSDSLKWIYTHLKDSNDVVTPRSVIDMLEGAINYQKKKIQTDFEDSQIILPIEAIKEGLNTASKSKLEKDIYNEFPREQQNIKALGNLGKHKLNEAELKDLYRLKWKDTVENLKRIGILKYIKHSNEYRIVHLVRPALGITYKY